MDIKVKNFEIKTSSVRPRALANKTGINVIIFSLLFVKICMYDMIHDFSVWLESGSNPADISKAYWENSHEKLLF